MRSKLTQRELSIIESASKRLDKLYYELVDSDRDVALNYGNGTVSSQLFCAVTALVCIAQEMY